MRIMLGKKVPFWNVSRKNSKMGDEIISAKMRKTEKPAKNGGEISPLRDKLSKCWHCSS